MSLEAVAEIAKNGSTPIGPERIAEVSANEDFISFIEQVDGGAFGSIAELQARLSPAGGILKNLVIVDGKVQTTRQGGLLREKRNLTEEQKETVLAEFLAKRSLERTAAQLTDFRDFVSSVIDDEGIAKRSELTGRLRAMDTASKVVLLEDGPLMSRGSMVKEKRSLNDRQKEIAIELFDTKKRVQQSQKELQDTRSYILDIDSEKISTEDELQTRLAAGQTETGYIMEGQSRGSGRSLLREKRAVSEPLAAVIRAEFTAKQQLTQKINAAKDYGSFLEDVVTGKISTIDELEGRLGAADNGGAVLIKNNYLTQGQELVRDTRRIDESQKGSLISIFNEIESLDDELKAALTNSLQNRGAQRLRQLLEARKSQAQTTTEINEVSRCETVINTALSQVSRTRAQVRLLVNTEQASTISELQQVLTQSIDYEEKDLDDAAMTNDVKVCLAVRKTSLETRRALSLITEPGRAIDAILGSDKPNDDRFTALLENLYQVELGNFQLAGYRILLDPRATRQNLEDFIDTIPARRRAGTFDYIEQAVRIEDALQQDGETTILSRAVVRVLSNFGRSQPAEIITQIQASFNQPGDEVIAMAVLDRYKAYIAARRGSQPNNYNFLFSEEVSAIKEELSPTYDFNEGLGNNKQAARYLAERFKKVFKPIVDAFRNDEDTKGIEDYLADGVNGEVIKRQNYLINVERLRSQRALSEIEENYLKSVELLSLFNPYLVGLANTDPGILSVYLKNHFDVLDGDTFDSISDGDYFPFVQIGLGAEGLISAGEVVRKRPDIAGQTLFIDAGEIGGPFAVPDGPAFGLNSANKFGFEYTLPALNAEIETRTVRAYGSPLRWYPGERNRADSLREGSINMSVDYLPAADDISDGRYATNEDEALALKMQAAMLVHKLLIRTMVVDEYLVDDDGLGNKIIVLERQNIDGTITQRKVRTDAAILPTGLGSPNFGFPFKGSSAEAVFNRSKEITATGGFPIFDTPLSIFSALVGREGKRAAPGKVFVVYGGGNTTDTFVANLGRIFETGNKMIRNIEKVYVVTDRDLSKRPRYAAAQDLLARNGQANLLEIVPTRVSGVAFSRSRSGKQDKLVLFAGNANIRNRKGEIIEADTVVPATGFTQDIDRLLSKVTGTSKRADRETVLRSQTLPTDPRIAVADRLINDAGQLIIGTASRTGFKGAGTAKFNQLPIDAREALLRNGAENAVAIGFRGPDTQAATRLFIEERGEQLPVEALAGLALPSVVDDVSVEIMPRTKTTVRGVYVDNAKLRNNVEGGSPILTSLVLYELGTIKARFNGKSYTGTTKITITPEEDDGGYSILSTIAPAEEWAAKLVANSNFVLYGRDAIRRRKGGTALELVVSFKYGRIDPTQTYVQAI